MARRQIANLHLRCTRCHGDGLCEAVALPPHAAASVGDDVEVKANPQPIGEGRPVFTGAGSPGGRLSWRSHGVCGAALIRLASPEVVPLF